MWWRVLLVGALLAGALGACAVVDPVDNRYDTISRSLAKARNESIFLNLVRASHDYPLSFVTVANVTPSLTNTTSFSLPSFLLGPHIPGYPGGGSVTAPLFTPGRDVIFGNTTAGNTTAVSTNFNVSTQETSAFYQGFLKPIDLQTLNLFHPPGLFARTVVLAVYRFVSAQQGRQPLRLSLRSAGRLWLFQGRPAASMLYRLGPQRTLHRADRRRANGAKPASSGSGRGRGRRHG